VCTPLYSSAASDVYKRQVLVCGVVITQTWRIVSQNPAESLRYE